MGATVAARDAAVRDIVRLSSSALAPLDLLARVAERIAAVLPYDAGGWLLTDPATGLHTGVVPVNVDSALQLRLIECEIAEADVNKFRDLARAQVPVALLSTATGGVLSRSVRHRTLYAPNGYGDELRGVFRTGSSVWGQVCLSRWHDRPQFTAADVAVVHRVAAHLARGLRAGQLRAAAAAATPTRATSPGVVIMDGAGRVESITDAAREQLGRLPTAGLELPVGVYEVAQRARRLTASDPSTPAASVRVKAGPNARYVLHGSRLDEDRSVVVVEPARPAELAPLIVAAHGLTAREQEVTELWSHGLDVTAVGTALSISPHTVHDHVKAVYAKLAVRNRAQLIAALSYEQILSAAR